MQNLIDLMASQVAGPLKATTNLERLLAESWYEFDGSDDEAMNGSKLLGRVESVEWQPPVLMFAIERHGATVRGSKRAEVHRWSLNLDEKTARIIEVRQRVVEPFASSLTKHHMEAIAAEIAEAIEQGREDHRYKVKRDGSIQMVVQKIIPDQGPKQTVQGRRKRLRPILDAAMFHVGWEAKSRNVYGLGQSATIGSRTT